MAENNPESLFLKLDKPDYSNEQVKDALVIIGLDGCSISYSSRIDKLFGRIKPNLENGFEKYIHPDDRDYIKQLFFDAVNRKSVLDYSEIEFRVFDKLGNTLWLSALPANYYDKDGKLIGFISSIRDITKRKKRELQLEKLLNYYSKTLDQTKFCKDLITHEINNIFSVIQMSSEIINDSLTEKNAMINNFIDLIQKSIKRGTKLIGNVQQFLNVKEDIDKILKKVDIFLYLNDAVNYIQQCFPERIIQIDIDSPYNDLYIMGNDLIADVFHNLLQNAVKYNKDSIVKIKIKISKLQIDDTEYIKMEFQDNGIGLSEFQKKLIFMSIPKHGTSDQGGMGLGLYLVKRIIEIYDGRIWIESNSTNDNHEGSTFVLLFKECIGDT